MKLKTINIDRITADFPEIINPRMVENKRYSKDGLFSQQIFGPIKSYHCMCSKNSYKGPRFQDNKCPVCNVDIISSEVRKKRFAKIELPFKVLNPLFFYIYCQNRTTVKKIINEILYYSHVYYYDDEDELHKLPFEDEALKDIDNDKKLMGLSGVVKYIQKDLDQFDEDDDEVQIKDYIKYLKNNLDGITMKTVLVIPPDFRPCGQNSSKNYVADDVNDIYNRIIKISNELKNIPYELSEDEEIYKTNFRYLQKLVFELTDFVFDKMSKKTGLIRSNILGKRVDFSGRAVISPDPTLLIDECYLPYWMVLEIFKPHLISHFINRRICKRYNQAIKIIEEHIQNNDPTYFNIVQEFCSDKICVLNRQPTLHRMGILAFKIKLHLENTVKIHPMLCSPYNADFDGDQMAVYIPITDESIQNVKDTLMIDKNIISPTDLQTMARPNQDIILGIYTATNATPEELENGEYVLNDIVKMTKGLYEFNSILPDDYEIIVHPVDGKELVSIMNDISFRYSSSKTLEIFDKIKDLGFKYATKKGYTLSLKQLYKPDLLELLNNLTGDKKEDRNYLDNDPIIKERLKECDFSIFIESGARGSWDQARQLVLTRGYIAGSDNKVRDNMIKSSLVSGHNPREFFESCFGSRKGLLDTATSTGDSGYLTRQLIYSTGTIEMDHDVEDCGTEDGLEIVVTNDMIKSILGRYYIKKDGTLKLIKVSNSANLVGKKIKLRSPIYCKNKKVCKKCYGNLHKILHSNQIGIIATQTVGERSTQLVLRTFHTSGSAKASKGDGGGDINEDIIHGMNIVKKIFHKPSDILKEGVTPEKLVKILFEIFGKFGGIHLVHFEVIVSSMMWLGDHRWRLHEQRNEFYPEYISILQVPTRTSWLMACAFSNLRQKLISGLVKEDVDNESSITSLFRL